MSDADFLKRKYKLGMGKELDLENPQTFSEKLQWLKLHNRKPEYIVPNFEQVKAFAEKISLRFIHHRLLALDIVLDKNNQPKMLEVNIQGFGAWLFQFTSGTVFREYTDSVMMYCNNNRSNSIKFVR